MTTIPEADGAFQAVDEADYHADRGSLSVSGAKLLVPPSCPAKFREYMDNGRKPKKEWDFGHVAHRLVLGKGAEFCVLDPAVHGLTKDGKPAKAPTATDPWKTAAAEARSLGLVPIHLDDFTKATAMAEKVRQHPVAGPLLAEGAAEVSLYHSNAAGVRRRGRIDWLEPIGDIDDYKTSTTANPAELVRKFWTLGYFMQAAWYLDLVTALGIAEAPRFRFVVQEKEPPHVVTVVEYDDEAIAEGRRLNQVAIDTYVRCRDTDTWPGYADESVVPISLPGWALRDGIQATADELISELEGIYR